MNLDAADLRKIADQIEKLGSIGVDVSQFNLSGHTIYLKRRDHPLDGLEFVVTGIDNKQKNNTHPNGGTCR